MPAQRTRPTFDVVVIGGGIVGVSAAAHLAERGRRVVLVEKTAIAAGASGRNSGVVQHPFDSVLIELYVETLAMYRELDGLDIAREPAGLLSVTHDVDGVRRVAAELASMYPHLEPSFLEPSEVRRLEPSHRRWGGRVPSLDRVPRGACRRDARVPAPGRAPRRRDPVR